MTSVKSKLEILKAILYIREIVREGNITRAASKNGIKQTNLSKMVKDCENLLGHPLFERTRQGIIPLSLALNIAREADVIDDMVQNVQRLYFSPKETAPVKICFSKGLHCEILQPINDNIEYVRTMKNADIIITTSKPHVIKDMVVVQTKIGRSVTQTVWVCAKNQAHIVALAEKIILLLNR